MKTHWIIWIALAVSYSCTGAHSFVTSPVRSRPKVQVVETTSDVSLLLQSRPSVLFSSGGDPTGPVVTVNDSVKYQQMDGFGASLTDSSAWLVAHKLNSAQRDNLWGSLFSPTAGIGINFLRQPMGASDFSSVGNYSFDDVPAGQTDPGLTNFSIAHDTAYLIPLLRQALAVNPSIKIVAAPWSAPAWMKTSGTMNGGSLNTSYFPALAQYFVRFVQNYKEQGISIYAVSPQNEPLNSNNGYPTERLTAGDETAFIGTHLGPAFKAAGLDDVKIFGYDHNWDNTSYAESVLADSSASKYVAGSAFHCYAGDVTAQSAVKSVHPEKDLWFTECSGTVGSNFGSDLAWNFEHLLIGATRNWARSASLWNLALDQNSGPQNGGCSNCRGVVTIDDTTLAPTITKNVEYYVLGHAAKFIVPGAYRIDSNTFGHGSIEDVAFQNPDGSIVLLVLNSGSSHAFTVNWRGHNFSYSLPPGAVATFVWKQ